MANIDLSKLSLKDLLQLQSQIGPAIVERRKAAHAEVKEKVAKIAAAAGFSLEDLVGGLSSKRKGSSKPVAIKYRNPDDATQTWTARGRKPLWLVERLSKRGVKIDDFLV